jgi:hypothetical protein
VPLIERPPPLLWRDEEGEDEGVLAIEIGRDAAADDDTMRTMVDGRRLELAAEQATVRVLLHVCGALALVDWLCLKWVFNQEVRAESFVA